MKFLDYFKKIKEKIFLLTDRDKQKLALNPYRDWMVMVGIFFLLVVFFTTVGFYIFLQINSGEIFEVEQREIVLPATIDTKKLQAALKIFKAKELKHQEQLENRLELPDPSL